MPLKRQRHKTRTRGKPTNGIKPVLDDASRDATSSSPTTGALTPKAKNARKRSRLLDLPKEIRLEIYEYLVKPDEIRIFSLKGFSKLTGLSDETIAATRFQATTAGSELALPLLRTCRTVYEEALPFLTKPRLLGLHPSTDSNEDLNEYCYKIHTLDVSWLSTLSQVDVAELRFGILQWSFTEDLSHTKFLFNCLNKDLHFKSLKLTVEDCPRNSDDDDREDLCDGDHPQSLLDVWSSLRPKESFSFQIELRAFWDAIVEIVDGGAWDLTGGKAVWQQKPIIDYAYWRSWYGDNRLDAIVDMVKKAVPLPGA